MASSDVGQKTLRFPTDVATDDVPNYICFRAQTVNFGGIDSYGNQFSPISNFTNNAGLSNGANFAFGPLQVNIQNPIASAISNFAGSIDGIVNNIGNRVNNLFGSLTGGLGSLSFNTNSSKTSNLLTKSVSGRLDLNSTTLSTGLTQSRSSLVSSSGIYLYMPNELGANLSASFDSQPTGQLAFGASEVYTGFESYMDGTGATNTSGAALDALKTAITSAGTAAFEEGPLRGVMQLQEGKVTNNFSYAVFKQIEHRTFKYSFKMVAKTEEESREIKSICDQFTYYMLPEKSNTSFHFYEIPCQWQIEYFRLGHKIEFIEQPKPCFLTACNITYGAEGLGHTYNNGAPVDVKLDLEFLEIEPMYRSSANIDPGRIGPR